MFVGQGFIMLLFLTMANKVTITYNGNLVNESITNIVQFTNKGVTYLAYLGKPTKKQNPDSFSSYTKAVLPLYKGNNSKLPVKPLTKLISSNTIKVNEQSNLDSLVDSYADKVIRGIADTDRKLKFQLSVENAKEAIQNKELLHIVKGSGLLPLKNYKGIRLDKETIDIFFGLSIFNPKGIITTVTARIEDFKNSQKRCSNVTIDTLKEIIGVSSNDPLF